ncbi:hypothetical protein HYDPIDRAFT_93611 [Hydnomerulius pinastri MD-312]|uniref:Uncharacterized protein n=1 Tax=Hydnomerulius pinastri MD-312 TaxID=994086 RepID=A0A0C9VB17_9AGAM|nr:hypothetical protein HYDPIDRAFT_93611 [Hydnomerulius pinastri MD-312]
MKWSLERFLVIAGLRSLRIVFLLTFTSFILMLFTVFSVPLITTFYFIDAAVPAGARFGVWGWCYDSGGECPSSPRMGYSFGSQVDESLTRALVFYPISTILCFLSTISLIPLLCGYPVSHYPFRYFSLLSFGSFISSCIAFVFMIGLWGTAATRFNAEGISVTFGPLPWMSLAATVALGLVSLSSGCGALQLFCLRGESER